MKCKFCGGSGKNYWGLNGVPYPLLLCPVCNGTGQIEQTNKEYMQTCNAEELGCFICENFFHGACGECRFCEKTELRHHCILGDWLKEKHKE